MSKGKTTSMNREAASRIISTQAKATGGKTPSSSFGTRVDRVLQQQVVNGKKSSP